MSASEQAELARLEEEWMSAMQARDMERHAKEKNIDAASLDYMRITLTCVQCHNYIRANSRPKS